MPTSKVKKKSRQLKSEGKAPSTQASPFIEEEIYQLHKKKTRAKSKKQAIAIGLSKARKAGVKIPNKKS